MDFHLVHQVTLRPEPGPTFHDDTRAPVVDLGTSLKMVEVCFFQGWLLVHKGTAYTAYPQSRVAEVLVLNALQ